MIQITVPGEDGEYLLGGENGLKVCCLVVSVPYNAGYSHNDCVCLWLYEDGFLTLENPWSTD